jgi:hypothetical protein
MKNDKPIFLVYHPFFNFCFFKNQFFKKLKSNQPVFSELTKMIRTGFIDFLKKTTNFHRYCNPYNEPKKENVTPSVFLLV